MMQSLLLIRAILNYYLKFCLLCCRYQPLLLCSPLTLFIEHPQSPGWIITGVIGSVYLSMGLFVSAWLTQRGYGTEVTRSWKEENLDSMVVVSGASCCHYFLLFDYEDEATFGLKRQYATCIKYCWSSSFPRVIHKFTSSYFNLAINSSI